MGSAKLNLQTGLAAAIFWFLGRGFAASSRLDPVIKQEIAPWPEGAKIAMKVDPHGPCMVLAKTHGSLVYQSRGTTETGADCIVYIKNIAAALLLLTGQMGTPQAFAEHRFYLKGDLIGFGMPMVRCLYRVEAYLFPKFITSRILKQLPQKQVSSARVYLATLFNI